MFFAVVFLAFSATLAGLFVYRKLNLKNNFCTGIDINKKHRPVIPEGSGIMLLTGLWIGVAYAFTTGGAAAGVLLLAVCPMVFGLIGFFDDTKNKFTKKPLSWAVRAVPISVFAVAFGYLFTGNAILAVPAAIFIAGLASLQNTFAGLNGWEVGSGFIISVFTAGLVYNTPLFIPAAAFSAGILALLLLNFYPAKVFPGDAGTLLIGSGIASIALLSNDLRVQATVALFFAPHAIDFFFLKLLTNAGDMTQQKHPPYKLLENGLLSVPDSEKPRLDFAKLLMAIFGPMHEKKIVLATWLVVFVNCLAWILVIR